MGADPLFTRAKFFARARFCEFFKMMIFTNIVKKGMQIANRGFSTREIDSRWSQDVKTIIFSAKANLILTDFTLKIDRKLCFFEETYRKIIF